MIITTVYSDEEGESHFGELEIELSDAGELGRLSDRFPARHISSGRTITITITTGITPRTGST